MSTNARSTIQLAAGRANMIEALISALAKDDTAALMKSKEQLLQLPSVLAAARSRLEMQIGESVIGSYVTLADAVSALDDAFMEQEDIQDSNATNPPAEAAPPLQTRETSDALMALNTYAKNFNKFNKDSGRRPLYGRRGK